MKEPAILSRFWLRKELHNLLWHQIWPWAKSTGLGSELEFYRFSIQRKWGSSLLIMGMMGLLFCSCSKSSPWAVEQIHSEKTEYCFTKLSYRSCDPVNGIDLEFVKDANQIQAYLTVHSTQVTSLKDDPRSIAVSFRSLQETVKCSAYRFQGGQRFLLSSENTEKIIELLKSKQEITILLNGYKTVLSPKDFEQKFETFLHPVSLRNPFQFSL